MTFTVEMDTAAVVTVGVTDDNNSPRLAHGNGGLSQVVTCTRSGPVSHGSSMGLETIDRLLLNHAGVWCELRGIFQPWSFAGTNERAPLRWGVIYVAEGGNCPRILCPACPRGRTFQPAVSAVNNVPRVVPKRFLVSAVILAINRPAWCAPPAR